MNVTLTVRQKEVLRLVCEDLTRNQIADQLGINVKTVDHHKGLMYRKLKCGPAGLVRFAINQGLVKT